MINRFRISLSLVIIVGILLLLSPFVVLHAQTILCYDTTILAIWQLNDIIPCLEDRIVTLENNPVGSGNATILNDLGDVVISSPSDNQFLRHDGTKWINESVSGGTGNATVLNDLGDVVIVTASTNDFIKYNGSYWVDNRIIEGLGIAISNSNEEMTVSTNCMNSGTASSLSEPICSTSGAESQKFKRLLEGSNIALSSNATHITIAVTGIGQASDLQVMQILCYNDQDVTKTNLPTTYADVYVTAFDNENYCSGNGGNTIDFTNSTYAQVFLQVDFVGAGTNTYRWVDVDNNANVLFESSAIGTDCDFCNSGVFAKPSWLTNGVKIEMQAKSSNGTNDPIVKGYVIMVK